MKTIATFLVASALATMSTAVFADGKSTHPQPACVISLDGVTHHRTVSNIPECQDQFNQIVVQHCSEVGVGWYGWAFIDYGTASAWELVSCE